MKTKLFLMFKNKNIIKLILFVIVFGFLITSTYYLMADPKQQSTQIGFGLFYHFVLLGAIYKRIKSIKIVEENKLIIVKKMYNHFKLWTTIIFPIFALYSAYIFLLASNNLKNIFFSSMRLQLLIITFQSIPFLVLSYQLKESISEKIMYRTFFGLYSFLSIIFGWTSAQISFYILKLPAQQDLFVSTYGLLIMPFVFIIYFDKIYDYYPVF